MKFLTAHFLSFKVFLFGLLYLSFFIHTPIAARFEKMVVSVPVADVRSEPVERKPFDVQDQDFKQITQILYGEHVRACRVRNGWVEVRALEQPIFVRDKWYLCCGWVRSEQLEPVSTFEKHNIVVSEPYANVYSRLSAEKRDPIMAISLGTKLAGVPYCAGWWAVHLPGGEKGFIPTRSITSLAKLYKLSGQTLRTRLITYAQLFLDAPYVWGGRSFYNAQMQQVTSTDCSGMVDLCFRAIGIEVPSNSRSQYEKSKKLKQAARPGDLVFLSDKKTPNNINHAMIYCGNDKLIEMHRGTTFKASVVSGTKRLGVAAEKLISGQKTAKDYVYIGTFFN